MCVLCVCVVCVFVCVRVCVCFCQRAQHACVDQVTAMFQYVNVAAQGPHLCVFACVFVCACVCVCVCVCVNAHSMHASTRLPPCSNT